MAGEVGSEVRVAPATGDLEELGECDEFTGPSGGRVQDVGELVTDPGGRGRPGEPSRTSWRYWSSAPWHEYANCLLSHGSPVDLVVCRW
ncbi:hypothetical protein [Streptomyces sp. NPDC001843]|uniref:hypothetical protein n=1 Tax=Streptomyces sp. NPDC001843 TaxID=3364617 RepID=UPI0036C80576